ncbi:MAG: hypothetical protein CBB67_014390 [Alteromonadaceae bacterium TMED7]|uniref:hypothetical protein n=1 Tax=Alteromonas sp. A081 TaxID=3410269 RepID=UPI000B65B920|nr:MAG: hypothetical protein CBB67_014390 [Alteromonadaceae bacterium TMED7]|tara:strand:+ start:3369 stop:3626 length:258 start_codon:yes stop_codon:yes gene_type:complete
MNNNSFELDIETLPTTFDFVIEKLYEAAMLHPLNYVDGEIDYSTRKGERKEQVLYYLQKTIHVDRHKELAIKFAKILLEDHNIPF